MIFIVMKNSKIIFRLTELQLTRIVNKSNKQKVNKSKFIREVLDQYFESKLSDIVIEKYRIKKSKNA
jgi:predicted DNA binding CopG/RHH family protein